MATVTLKNVPDEVYARLKKKAAQNRRSINNEAIVCLENVLGIKKADVEAVLLDLRAFRRRLKRIPATEKDLKAAINEGRP